MLIASPTKISQSYIIIGLFLIMMVVFISLKKDYMKRRELESVQVNSVHYSRLFLPPIKKNIKTTPYVLPGSQEVYIMTTPLLLPPFVSSLTDFSYFLASTSRTQPARAVEGPPGSAEHDDHHSAWVSQQNLHPGELSSCLHCGACCMLQVYGVIMGLNTFCNPL